MRRSIALKDSWLGMLTSAFDKMSEMKPLNHLKSNEHFWKH